MNDWVDGERGRGGGAWSFPLAVALGLGTVLPVNGDPIRGTPVSSPA